MKTESALVYLSVVFVFLTASCDNPIILPGAGGPTGNTPEAVQTSESGGVVSEIEIIYMYGAFASNFHKELNKSELFSSLDIDMDGVVFSEEFTAQILIPSGTGNIQAYLCTIMDDNVNGSIVTHKAYDTNDNSIKESHPMACRRGPEFALLLREATFPSETGGTVNGSIYELIGFNVKMFVPSDYIPNDGLTYSLVNHNSFENTSSPKVKNVTESTIVVYGVAFELCSFSSEYKNMFEEYALIISRDNSQPDDLDPIPVKYSFSMMETNESCIRYILADIQLGEWNPTIALTFQMRKPQRPSAAGMQMFV